MTCLFSRYIDHKCQLLFGSLRFTCLHTPGHTKGCVTYLLHGSAHNSPDSIFTGDFIFASGVGRVFDSTIEEMLKSIDLILKLKDDTLIWQGHECTLDNIKFEYSLDRSNSALVNRYIDFLHLKQDKVPLVPTTLKEEKIFNPFFRTGEPSLLKALDLLENGSDDATVLENSTDLIKLRVIAFRILMCRRIGGHTPSKLTEY
uniref:Hydroxyacylglutathione hydrolase C-terminal domain-containing protein n=1 Tax=Romanomermis culicivorax TaxID=13658 RepID=A0A915K6Z6_ROMCU